MSLFPFMSAEVESKNNNNPIYSWDYGQDLEELIGQGYETDFIKSEIERRVQECLMINEHVKGCSNFEISLINDQLQLWGRY